MRDECAREFVTGFVTGVIVAGFIAFVVTRILRYWGKVKAIGKPQTTKSETDKSPWKALGDGCKSLISLILSIVVGILVLAVICLLVAAYIFGPEKVLAFVRSVAQLQ